MTNFATINGKTYSDGVNDGGTGVKYLGNGGHRNNFVPLVADVVTVAAQVSASETASKNSAAEADGSRKLAQQAQAATIAGSLDIPTGLPNVRPALNMDFANSQKVDPRVKFTRASTATRINKNGLIETVPANMPRINYHPVTLKCRGLLIEESRTNSIIYSDQLDNAAFVKNAATITANAATAPDGMVSGDKLIESATAGTHYIKTGALTVANNAPVTFTAYAKYVDKVYFKMTIYDSDTNNYAFCKFNIQTGVLVGSPTTGGSASAASADITSVGNGWYRCKLTCTPSAISTGTLTGCFVILLDSAGVGDSYTGNGTSGIYLWGLQCEAGARETSYIPTTSAAVTRSADIATLDSVNFTSWFRPDEGTVVAVTDTVYYSAAQGVFALGDPALAYASRKSIYVYTSISSGNSSHIALAYDAAVEQSALVFTCALTSNQEAAIALAYKLNDYAGSSNGTVTKTDTTGTVPTMTALSIGSLNAAWNNAGVYANGHVASIAYYPKRLMDAELQILSTL